MAFWSRLTPVEEDFIWVAGKARSFGERISFEVLRAGADLVVDVLESVSPPLPEAAPVSIVQESVAESLPLSESAPLSSAQDDIVESLASSSSFQEQHDSVCSEETSEDQGSQDSHDVSSDLAPESVCSTSSLACSVSLRTSPSSSDDESSSLSSQDESASVSSPQQQQAFSDEVTALQGSLKAPQASVVSLSPSEDAVIFPLKDQETSSEVLVSDALLCEQGLCGARKETFSEAVLVQEAETGASQAVCLTSSREGGCLFERLDEGCLYQILSHLDSPSLIASSLVCRLWSEVSSAARHTLSLEACTHVSFLPNTLTRFPQVQTLKVVNRACYSFSDRSLRHLAKYARGLQRLELAGSEKISDAGLAAFLRGCPELHTLIITFNSSSGHKAQCVNLSGVAFEGLQCKLTHVRLEACSGFTNKGLKALAAACPQLCEFSVKREAQAASLASGVEEVARSCPGLVKVTLHRSGATDSCLRAFAANCPHLGSFSISCEDAVSDAGVASLMDHLRNLKQLTLFNNRGLTVIPHKKAGVPLQDLSLGRWLDLSDDKLQEVSKQSSLQELHFIKCPALTDATVLKVLVSCRQLKRILVRDCPLVTQEILKGYQESGSGARFKIDKCVGIPAGALPEEPQLLGRIIVS